jgi:two-component system, LytTR family, sensor kinase
MFNFLKKIFNSKYSAIWLNILGWLVFLVAPVFLFRFTNHNFPEMIFHLGTAIIFYYLNTLVLIPKFLFKRKFKLYFLSLFGSLIIAFAFSCTSYKLAFKKESGKSYYKERDTEYIGSMTDSLRNSSAVTIKQTILKKIYNTRSERRLPFPMRTVMLTLMILGLSTSIKVTQEWFRNEKLRKEAENTQLNAELAFLKSQVNPHFLFNTLNSIYSLANRRSEKTADAIAKLSNILRYMLYKTENKTVNLEEEVQYLSDYIELQKFRLYDNIFIKFDVTGNIQSFMIAPMLLLPFVENAFKHGVNTTNKCFINISLTVKGNELYFEVTNADIRKDKFFNDENSGIGLQNVKRRLDLIYPGAHELLTEKKDDIYIVRLKLRLSENELFNS